MRTLLLAVLLLGGSLAWLAPPAQAQTTKAYAPENLSQLAVPDRIRVIELEYAEQSGGRRIPDDQLEFYLDQVRSGWGFSQIKQDIATSLGGGGRPGGYTGGGWHDDAGLREVRCESHDSRYTECRTDFRGQARLARQISSTRCNEGSNWGSRPGLIWVRGGCRGSFVEDDRYTIAPTRGVVCESERNRYNECRTGYTGHSQLVRTLSQSPCIEGSSWGSRFGAVWVSQGCRGQFEELHGGGGHAGDDGYNVTCSSVDEQYRTCSWVARNGQPVLIEQLSRSACIEGRTWGWDRREGLWVDRGCRGRFGVR